jgi:carbamoyltransferase
MIQTSDSRNRRSPVTKRRQKTVAPALGNYRSNAEVDHTTFGPVDDATLKKLRQRLKSARYAEKSISTRLRIWHISAVTLQEYPLYLERLKQRLDALSIMISLFLLQSEMPRKTADSALSSNLVDELLIIGFLTRSTTDTVAATVSIYPCSGCYFITDHHFRPVSRDYNSAPHQPVMHLGQDSYALAYLAMKPQDGDRVLDMCAGSGVQGILAAHRAKRVVGVDINPRAVEFARINARLNSVAAKCDFRCGSMYEAVRQESQRREGERFNLILGNPPFVPSPNTGRDRLLFRDGGPAGDEILGPLLAGLLKHMTPTGSAAVISMFADEKRCHHKAKIKKWVGMQTSVDLLLLRICKLEREELAFWITSQAFGDEFADFSYRYQEWLAALRFKQIVRMTCGVLLVSRSQAPSFRTVDFPLSQALSNRKAKALLAC